jgi:leucyl-tRNA synthetase
MANSNTSKIDDKKISEALDGLEDTAAKVQVRAAAHTAFMTMVTTYQKTNEEGNQVVRNIINGATRNM